MLPREIDEVMLVMLHCVWRPRTTQAGKTYKKRKKTQREKRA